MKLFFSWQSDLPEVKTFIRNALQQICNDLKIEYDEDSRDHDNAEYILNNILLKIDHSTVVVGDLTFVGTNNDGEKIPNPNVMFELGYAEARVTRKNLMMVMCSDYGDVHELPFDLNKRSAPSFSMKDIESQKAFKSRLAKALKKMIDTPLAQQQSLTLNKYEKTILYWLYATGDSVIINTSLARTDALSDTDRKYFNRAFDDKEYGRYSHAVRTLKEKELLAATKNYRDDEIYILTVDGEELAKITSIEDTNAVLEKK